MRRTRLRARLAAVSFVAASVACALAGTARTAGPAAVSRAGHAPLPNLGLYDSLRLPAVGDRRLTILTPTLLELSLITTEPPGGRPGRWDFVGADGSLRIPAPARFRVAVQGAETPVTAVGFKRRVLYAPLKVRDLRIGSYLYLRLAEPVREGALVAVANPDGSLWPASDAFTARAERTRLSPVIHVNQVGYLPDGPKVAMAGYYLGSLGELDLAGASRFDLVSVGSGKSVLSGDLRPRPEKGWTYAPLPYQHVLEADFSKCRVPGEYRLQIPGLGASLPFRINEGTAAAFARTYALGLYHQRCGAENALPFTRFVHAPCHTAPAEVPTMENTSVQRQLAGESANYRSNPLHTAPQLKDVNASLYPFVRQASVDVAGGHHDAGDYSKYTINSAQLIHTLVFAADNFPGAAELDNLGLPESGDGKSDLLQVAKWETDFLAKMQDEDGGFYFLVYPKGRAYENDALPDHGDRQVVFPKTTAVTAAATAALAQAASSPRFKRAFPEAAAQYLSKARKGWAFLERAWAKHGRVGAYQKITHYGDTFMDNDEIAWAATELYLGTGEQRFHDELRRHFDPSDKSTYHWGWERMFESYGCAIRSYAFAAKSGRVKASALDSTFLAKCRAEIEGCAGDHVEWAAESAYGTSFPTETKRFRTAGWYFSTSQAFDIAVAALLDPKPERLRAIAGCIDYEAGCNPNNVTFVTGIGWRRQREIVHQFAMNDRRVLPPSGIPLGSVQEGFMYLDKYGSELGALTFPPDGARDGPYPFYDRWGDSFNVATEFTIPIQGRCLAVTAWLMAQSSLKSQAWRAAAGRIVGIPAHSSVPFRVTFNAEGMDSRAAQIVWEAAGQEPQIGQSFTVTPPRSGPAWIEAEATWPDGRRAFAVVELGRVN
ncbi:MAG TPA: glycoside hydrolase family 9 protein [Chthonomonadaceae bacterium]|nr:glycoside hydrolase family 9 protein [Chthonomonadaceae bacterium]